MLLECLCFGLCALPVAEIPIFSEWSPVPTPQMPYWSTAVAVEDLLIRLLRQKPVMK